MASIHHDDKGIHFDDGRKLIFSTFKIQVFIWLVLVTTLGGFGAWAYFAPLSSAAIAPGVIIVESKRKPIQHLEGGIVEIVHVSDGDHVQKGELLITLSHTQAQASLLRLRAQWQSDLARLNRLQSELASHQEIQFDMRLLSLKSDPNVSSLLDTQSKLFNKRQSLKSGESEVLEQKVEQSKLDLQGFQQRYLAGNRSLKYLEEQVQMHQDLLVSGNTSRSRLLDLQRERSQLQGDVADLKARIGRSKRTIAEAELELINADYTYAKTLGEEIQDLERKLNETREAMVNAQDILTRVEIRAPQSGVVVGLNIVSENAIVPPGETLMELVPQDDELIVEALVKPEDIEALRIGLNTQVRLTAYSFRRTPPINGKLIHISADRISDQATGSSAYLARVSLDTSELEALENISLYPGMPAEVMILLEQQTPLEYLLNPLSVSAYKAMREI